MRRGTCVGVDPLHARQEEPHSTSWSAGYLHTVQNPAICIKTCQPRPTFAHDTSVQTSWELRTMLPWFSRRGCSTTSVPSIFVGQHIYHLAPQPLLLVYRLDILH